MLRLFNYQLTILLAQRGVRGSGEYGAPYDSTQGVPAIVFIVCWVIILTFLIRLAWEYRDMIFKRKNPPTKR